MGSAFTDKPYTDASLTESQPFDAQTIVDNPAKNQDPKRNEVYDEPTAYDPDSVSAQDALPRARHFSEYGHDPYANGGGGNQESFLANQG